MVWGPLARLRCFGCIFPCHESDEEYNARMAAFMLDSLPIQWYRPCGDRIVSLDAYIRLADTDRSTPCLKMHCRDPNRLVYSFQQVSIQEVARETILVIPLHEIDKVVLMDTDYQSQIQVFSATQLLFQFGITTRGDVPARDVVKYLNVAIHWDRERRAELQDRERRSILEQHQRLVYNISQDESMRSALV